MGCSITLRRRLYSCMRIQQPTSQYIIQLFTLDNVCMTKCFSGQIQSALCSATEASLLGSDIIELLLNSITHNHFFSLNCNQAWKPYPKDSRTIFKKISKRFCSWNKYINAKYWTNQQTCKTSPGRQNLAVRLLQSRCKGSRTSERRRQHNSVTAICHYTTSNSLYSLSRAPSSH